MSLSEAARWSISGAVSSRMAATTTESPCARAASSSRNGKRPLPAMRPSFMLFDNPTLAAFDKPHQQRHVLAFELPHLCNCLRRIHLRRQQQPECLLQPLQPFRRKAAPREADLVDAEGLVLPPRRSQ